MLLKLRSFINNDLIIKTKHFSTIIGSKPSQGARSPILWNACYKKMNMDCKMYPLDVDPLNFNSLIEYLFSNKNFLASAIAVPFKENLINNLDIKIPEKEKKIGAINLIYRKKNEIYGINTDGIAACKTLEKINYSRNKKILLLGCGGTGKAVAANIASTIDNNQDLTIAVRNTKKIIQFGESLNAKIINWDQIENIINDVDIIVNSTTLGNIDHLNNSPINYETIKKLDNKKIFFDINYQPLQTKLIKIAQEYGHDVFNGSFMNLYQAVVAFDISNNINSSNSITYQIMKDAIS